MKLNLLDKIFVFIVILLIITVLLPFIVPKHTIKEDRYKKLSFLEHKSAWVDSMINQTPIDEMLGQMFILEVDQNTPLDSLLNWIAFYKIGGLVFKDFTIEKFLQYSDTCQKTASIPLFISLTYSDQQLPFGLPGGYSLGVLQDTILLHQYFENLIYALKIAKINFMPAPSIHFSSSRESFPYFESVGDENIIQIEKLRRLANLLNQSKILDCAGYFDHFYDFQNDTAAIRRNEKLISAVSGVLEQASGIAISRNFTENKIFQKPDFQLREYLKEYFKFEGLIIGSEGISKHQNNFTKLLNHGFDAFFLKDSIRAYFHEFENSGYFKNTYSSKIQAAFRRILLAKSWTGNESFKAYKYAEAYQFLKNQNRQLLIRSVCNKSCVLLKDSIMQIPYTWLEGRKFIHISIGNKTTAFNVMFRNYANLVNTHISIDSLQKKVFSIPTNYNSHILSLNIPVSASFDTLALVDILKKLQKQGNLCLINYGSPLNLKKYGFVGTILQGNRSKYCQELIAQILFGAKEVDGKSAMSINSQIKLGSGVERKKIIRLGYSLAEEVGYLSDSLTRIDSVINDAIKVRAMPGAVILLVKDHKIFYQKAYGYHTYERKVRTKINDIFDLASISKVAGTTLAFMKLMELDTSIHTEDSIKYYLKDTSHCTFKNIRLAEFFRHRSGLPPNMPIIRFIIYRNPGMDRYDLYYSPEKTEKNSLQVAKEFYFENTYKDTIWAMIDTLKLDTAKTFVYSDVNLNVIYKVFQNKSKLGLDKFLSKYFYYPIGCQTIGYNPLDRFDKDRMPPTEEDKFWRKQIVQGYVHDPSAALYGGVAGNAGLFSDAKDLAIIFQMLLNKGEYGGKRYLQKETVKKFTTRPDSVQRGLGFSLIGKNTFGHTGFTGTSVWADPDEDFIIIILSNRSFPNVKNKKFVDLNIRKQVMDIVNQAKKGKMK